MRFRLGQKGVARNDLDPFVDLGVGCRFKCQEPRPVLSTKGHRKDRQLP